MTVFVGYESNDNSLMTWENVDWMVCRSDQQTTKHLYQRLLPGKHQFPESER